MNRTLNFQIVVACVGLSGCLCQPSFGQSANDYSGAFDVSGVTATQNSGTSRGDLPMASAGAAGESAPQTVPANKPAPPTDYSKPQLEQTFNGNLAGGSVNPLPVPSGEYSFGFTGGIGTTLKSLWSRGGYLPPTSTGSVELNVAQ